MLSLRSGFSLTLWKHGAQLGDTGGGPGTAPSQVAVAGILTMTQLRPNTCMVLERQRPVSGGARGAPNPTHAGCPIPCPLSRDPSLYPLLRTPRVNLQLVL